MLQDKLHVLLLVFPYLKRNSPPFFQLLQKELHELPRRVWKWLYRSYGNDYNGVSTKKWSVNKNFNQISKNRFQLKQLIPKGHSLRKQPTFRDDTTSFPVKWRPRNDTTYQIGVVLRIGWKLPRPIRSTTQIWVVTRHQYGISALVSQTSFGGKPVVTGLRNVGCFLRLNRTRLNSH